MTTQLAALNTPLTATMLDGLLSRWKGKPRSDLARPSTAESTRAVQGILASAIGRYEAFLSPRDQALYATLMGARHPAEIRALFFEAFDLLVRTRGAAVAVLRIRDIHDHFRLS